MELAGWKCLLGVERDAAAAETFSLNHPRAQTYCGDIKGLGPAKLADLLGGKTIHAVVGGPPCQGFSTVGVGNPRDGRNGLFLEFVRIVKLTCPDFVVMENVTGLVAQKNEKVLQKILRCFQQLGYTLNVRVMSAQRYGVPERRRRTILLGTRLNVTPRFPRETHDVIINRRYRPPVTVGQALSDLRDSRGVVHNHDLAAARIANKLDRRRLARIPEGKGIRYQRDEQAYLPSSLRLGVDWQALPEGRFRQCKYQRLDREHPSPTIMTHRHTYFHPTEERYLTPREAAKLQSFPNDFVFCGSVVSQWRQIGNAVPPLLGKAIGRQLRALYRSADKGERQTSGTLKLAKLREVRGEAFAYRSTKRSCASGQDSALPDRR